jgi:endonuclease III
MDEKHIEQAIQILGNSLKYWDLPIVSNLAALHRSPFSILISTVLSSRTKDEVTAGATERLMSKAASPEQMLQLPEEQIAELIYPVGFYKTKARAILHICRELIDPWPMQRKESASIPMYTGSPIVWATSGPRRPPRRNPPCGRNCRTATG